MVGKSLPEGWVRDVDGYGKPYYWHVASGITQREHPLTKSLTGSGSPGLETGANVFEELTDLEADLTEKETEPKIHRFFVTSLGWLPLNLSELAADQVSRSIQKCIENLSCDKRAVNLVDSVASWGGDGKKICVDVDCEKGDLSIRDATSLEFDDLPVGKPLISYSLNSIRAWGIGVDGDKDFAYVVRDPLSQPSAPNFQCHVLRCEDGDASKIASIIYEGCSNSVNNKIEPIENTDQIEEPVEENVDVNSEATVPPHFDVSALSFNLPQPADEPRKIILCHFVGSAEADGPVGMKVMNEAIAKALQRHPVERWHFAAVMISPSAVVVRDASEAHHDVDHKDRPLLDCRVRYLSFVGIASDDVRVCAFITHSADDTFFAHVFHCEPSAGALSKAIEAACELRFQKCLDSRHSVAPPKQQKPEMKMTSSISSISSLYGEKISTKMSNFANSFAKRFTGMVSSGGQTTQRQSNEEIEDNEYSSHRSRNRLSNTKLPNIVLPSAISNFAHRVGLSGTTTGQSNRNGHEIDSLMND